MAAEPLKKMDFSQAAKDWDTPERVERARLIALKMAETLALGTDGEKMPSALEFGCGTGLVGFFLKEHFKRLALTDTSPGMIEVLKEKIQASGEVHLEAALFDLLASEPPAEGYDLIFSSMVIHHIKETELLLNQIKGHLKPGGRVCLVDLNQDDGSFHAEELDYEGHHGFDQKLLSEKLMAAGFEEVASETFFRGTRVRKGRESAYSLFIMTGKAR